VGWRLDHQGLARSISTSNKALLRCVFRRSVTDRFGIVTAEFGSVTDHFGDVTDERLAPA